jgi:ketosteroid isomerase-like protein
MRKLIIPVILIISVTAAASCNSGGTSSPEKNAVSGNVIDLPSAKSFIDSINQKFTEQVFNGDSVALASHYWPDGEIMLSNSESVKGKDAVPIWGELIRMGVKHFSFQTTDITLGGDLLVETGTYEMKAADQKLIDRGKYVVVWKFKDGEWKLFRDIGNSSLSVPPAK